MESNFVQYVVQDSGILIEAALIFYLARTSKWRGQGAVAFYLSSLVVGQLTRACFLHEYGLTSLRYYYAYWSTDFLLVMSAFGVVCLFFRRACWREEKIWRLIRIFLVFLLVLVAAISGVSLSLNRHDFFTYFLVAFNQKLYFTCLVLNTLLYLMLHRMNSADDQLELLVCGMGIQFAGPAATLALVHLTYGGRFAKWLAYQTIPLCTFGMLLVWAYVIVYVPKTAGGLGRRDPPLRPVPAELSKL
ncbi:membrane hypothetical protein [Acidobacteriia bacterium SbA2]|nr:membrane hypothetical protein [Acidobacteriia bacterium SbA2]